MLTLNLGPLALGLAHLCLLASLLLASLVGAWLGRKRGGNPEAQLFLLFLLALLGARLAFVLEYASLYAAQPWKIIDLRDGGFTAWAGIGLALPVAGLLAWRTPRLRVALLAGLGVGLLSWAAGHWLLDRQAAAQSLPALTLQDLRGKPQRLADYRGQPLVVNLWASWCPPCRREMPVLQQAHITASQVRFLLVNQGESPEVVRRFIEEAGLQSLPVLLDPAGQLGGQVGSRMLPTTLFYDRHGQLRASHLGELSAASLSHWLEQIEASP